MIISSPKIPEFDPRGYPFGRALLEAYERGEDDETMEPLVLVDGQGPAGRLKEGDSVIFYDLRGEREIELTESLTNEEFSRFPATSLSLNFATMIEYDPRLPVSVAFPPEERIGGTLSEVISARGLTQAKICESEKEVHISYFFNGKRKGAFPGESRVIIPSPSAENYALCPEMSASRVTEETVMALEDESLSFILTNYANVDVVGHIEDRQGIIRAVETVDGELGRLVEAARKNGVTMIITADHGTVEKWYYANGAIDTGHTASPVPFLVVTPEEEAPMKLEIGGSLTDVAPTALCLMGLPVPEEMTGRPLTRGGKFNGIGRLLMVILDGWGLGDGSSADLIAAAGTPTWDSLRKSFPNTSLKSSGEAVGLPPGTVGNSEAGHLHLGAGRLIYSDRVRIDRALEDGSFFRNYAFLEVIEKARKTKKALHMLGILSFYSSHGSFHHLLALMDLAKAEGLEEVYLHAFLGRRGERPESGAAYAAKVENYAKKIGLGRLVSVIGRFFALDREENWDRIERTYRLLVEGKGRPLS